ncbi:methionyl-tRNA formyltransferase [Stigmatella sp. ncwal1]|uniref:Methionyl-tRNA formyltransferase n=1 Tax=Stigmatella ashevillensis TaxID=2995309 RepID=A0ABT5DM34_9BACT|nr:methionyl-tRNA formyltransferase [Stigmatella ashevillena]MDC0714731.1 methionyl-tRNA formyltransferase [Stigmatella ashevillena]
MTPAPPPSDGAHIQYSGWRIALLTVSPLVVASISHLLQARGHTLAAVVTTGPGGPRPRTDLGRSMMHQVLQHIPSTADILLPSRRDRIAPLLKAVQPDLLLSFFFPWRIPPEALALPPQGAINAHPGLLPRYRGPNPLGWTLLNGEPELSLTFHRMDAQFDTGPLLAQGGQPIEDADTAESLTDKMMALGERLLPEALSRLSWGDQGEPQPELGAGYAGNFGSAERELDWSQPALAVHRRVRACRMASWQEGHPFAALATLEGQRQQVQSTVLTPAMKGVRAAPGTILMRDGTALLVQCGDTPLWVIQSEPWQG